LANAQANDISTEAAMSRVTNRQAKENTMIAANAAGNQRRGTRRIKNGQKR
jgi:hypothetical protein